MIGRIVRAQYFSHYSCGMLSGDGYEGRVLMNVTDVVEEVQIYSLSVSPSLGPSLVQAEHGENNSLHMLSIITRKFFSMSVIEYRSLMATSQLRIAFTLSSHLVARA